MSRLILEYLPVLLRVLIYYGAPIVAGLGFADLDRVNGTLVIRLDDLAIFAASVVSSGSVVITFWISRILKRRGGKT